MGGLVSFYSDGSLFRSPCCFCMATFQGGGGIYWVRLLLSFLRASGGVSSSLLFYHIPQVVIVQRVVFGACYLHLAGSLWFQCSFEAKYLCNNIHSSYLPGFSLSVLGSGSLRALVCSFSFVSARL